VERRDIAVRDVPRSILGEFRADAQKIFLHTAGFSSYSPRPIMNLKTFDVAALAGDGIGPEVMREAIKVLRAVEGKFPVRFNITEAPVGWAGIDAAGDALPDSTLAFMQKVRCGFIRLCRAAGSGFDSAKRRDGPNARRCCGCGKNFSSSRI